MKINTFTSISDKCNLKGHLLIIYFFPSRSYYRNLPLISVEVLRQFFVLS